VPRTQSCHYTGPANAPLHLKTKRGEGLGDEGRSAMLLEPRLRVGTQMMPPRPHLWPKVGIANHPFQSPSGLAYSGNETARQRLCGTGASVNDRSKREQRRPTDETKVQAEPDAAADSCSSRHVHPRS